MQMRFDFEQAREARDRGMESVVANGRSWHNEAMAIIAGLPSCWIGLGEDIRATIVRSRVGEPHREQAWGALILMAKKRGLIAATGRRLPMKDVRSHLRMTDEYRRTEAN